MKYDICVVGGCTLDAMYYEQNDGRYNSKPDIISPGGKALNQAIASARAGAKTTLISRIGKNSEIILRYLEENKVSTENVEIIAEGSDIDSIFVNKNGENTIQRKKEIIKQFSIEMIENNRDILLDSKIVVSQLKAPLAFCKELINFCYAHKKMHVLTPCRPKKLASNLELIDKLSIITANRSECETIFGTQDIEACVSKNKSKLIVTMGEEGVVYHNGTRIVKVPAIPVKVIDTTGCGDCFNGNLVYCLSNGYQLEDAIIRAQYAAALKAQVKTATAGMPTSKELEDFINKR